jgi:peptidylprolyl isomerase
MTHWKTTLFCFALASLASAETSKPLSQAELLAASTNSEWRRIPDSELLWLDTTKGPVLIQTAPRFAPRTLANMRALAQAGGYRGYAMLRSQDNYVVQFGPVSERKLPAGVAATVPAEWSIARSELGVAVELRDGDGYAEWVGFSASLPVAGHERRRWLAHCYGMVGVGRDNGEDSGNGSEIYVVNGHAPRHLDRNITLIGRVVFGVENIMTETRGTEALGFYTAAQRKKALQVRDIQFVADLSAKQRAALPLVEVLDSTSATFAKVTEQRRNRRDDWYKIAAGHIELCNVPLPVRTLPYQAETQK